MALHRTTSSRPRNTNDGSHARSILHNRPTKVDWTYRSPLGSKIGTEDDVAHSANDAHALTDAMANAIAIVVVPMGTDDDDDDDDDDAPSTTATLPIVAVPTEPTAPVVSADAGAPMLDLPRR